MKILMSSLISRTMGTLHQCSVKEYVDGDNSLSACVDMDDRQWDKNFLDSLTEEVDPVTGEEEEEDVPPPVPKLQSYKEAICSMEDIKIFLEDCGCLKLASCAWNSLILMQSTLDHSHCMNVLLYNNWVGFI